MSEQSKVDVETNQMRDRIAMGEKERGGESGKLNFADKKEGEGLFNT